MSRIDVRMPKYPECWKTCGNCGSGDVFIDAVCVAVGDKVACDEALIVLETGKVALDIPSPYAGTVVELAVAAGEKVAEGQLIAVLEK